jgi:hypothetical protein
MISIVGIFLATTFHIFFLSAFLAEKKVAFKVISRLHWSEIVIFERHQQLGSL